MGKKKNKKWVNDFDLFDENDLYALNDGAQGGMYGFPGMGMSPRMVFLPPIVQPVSFLSPNGDMMGGGNCYNINNNYGASRPLTPEGYEEDFIVDYDDSF